MLRGLAFRETMHGTYWRLDAPTDVLSIAVVLEAHAPDLAELLRERRFEVRGTLDAERLATARPVTGTIAFRFVQQGRLHYRLAFEGDDGRGYELGGQKEWSALAPVESLTILAASLYDGSNREFARATLRFYPRTEGWAMLRSLRVASLF